jgi:L-2-hydroxyglutarate oxidase
MAEQGQVYDIAMIGAGIVGLASARELHRRLPGLRIAVLDKEPAPGLHQSSHNSGVLHSGVYYAPGSLKARLCVRGKHLMEEYAAERGIAVETCGKLIVALGEAEFPRLRELAARSQANGVAGTRILGPEELRTIEPHAAGERALHVPGTGIIDFGHVVTTMADELRADGVDVLLGHEVTAVGDGTGSQLVRTTRGVLRARHVMSCAGLHADRVAGLTTAPDVRIVPFRGDYYTLSAEARSLCRGLIYPVPDPSLPFLGVHFTKRIDGAVWAGPNAVLALAREGYRRRTFDTRDTWETLRYRGFRRLAGRYWRTGGPEMWRDLVKRAFVKELQRYVPEVRADQLTFGPSGVRAQALAPDGSMVDDFHVQGDVATVHVLNAPSPAATAALAIAEHLADRAEQQFGLNTRP